MNFSWTNPATGLRAQVENEQEARRMAWEQLEQLRRDDMYHISEVTVFRQEKAGEWTPGTGAVLEQAKTEHGYSWLEPGTGKRSTWEPTFIGPEWPDFSVQERKEHIDREIQKQLEAANDAGFTSSLTIYHQEPAFTVKASDTEPEAFQPEPVLSDPLSRIDQLIEDTWNVVAMPEDAPMRMMRAQTLALLYQARAASERRKHRIRIYSRRSPEVFQPSPEGSTEDSVRSSREADDYAPGTGTWDCPVCGAFNSARNKCRQCAYGGVKLERGTEAHRSAGYLCSHCDKFNSWDHGSCIRCGKAAPQHPDSDIPQPAETQAEKRARLVRERVRLTDANPLQFTAAVSATCRRCGKEGSRLDEFTSPYTGLCAECSEAERTSSILAPREAAKENTEGVQGATPIYWHCPDCRTPNLVGSKEVHVEGCPQIRARGIVYDDVSGTVIKDFPSTPSTEKKGD